MRTKQFQTLIGAILLLSVLCFAQPTTVWNPAANPESTGLWSQAENWTAGAVPEGDVKVVFNVPDVQKCILDDTHTITTLVMGDNNEGDTLHVAAGGSLTTGDVWSAVGYNAPATMVVDSGGTVTFGKHMWIGFLDGSNGTVVLNGGTINVSEMTGIGWSGGKGTVFINDGEFNLANIHPTDSIKDSSMIVIGDGVMNITGDHVSKISDYIAAGKIIAQGGSELVDVIFEAASNQTKVYQLPQRQATTVWNPAGNPSSTGLWSEAANWTDGRVPEDNKVVFNVPEVQACVLDIESSINQLVMGDNGDGDTLRVVDGGQLTMGVVWSAIGYNSAATMVVDSGGVVTFGEHLWIGFEPGSDGVLVLNGGTVNVPQMTGLGWNGGKGTIYMQDGELNLANIHPSQSISDSCLIDISGGVINITGDHVAKVKDYVQAGKIIATGATGNVLVTFDEESGTTKIMDGEEPVELVDLTDLDVCVIVGSNDEEEWINGSSGAGSPDNERPSKLIDDDVSTKYLVRAEESWVDLYTNTLSHVTSYTITSANDAPTRDPKDWELQGWDQDSGSWVTLHSVVDNPSWPDFFTPLTWEFENDAWYSTYRLHITALNGDAQGLMQIAELQLWGELGEQVDVVTPDGMLNQIAVPIANGNDDAEEYGPNSQDATHTEGALNFDSSDLEIVYDADPQYVGLLFRNVDILPSTNVLNAFIQFTVDAINKGVTDSAFSVTIHGVMEPNVEAIVDEPFFISSRPMTTTSVTWQPAASVAEGDAGRTERTTDISEVIEEIVFQKEWAAGNNLMLVISGDAAQDFDLNREFESFDGDPNGAPVLHLALGDIFASVEHDADPVPTNFVLQQNYPNPFNPVTMIQYQLAAHSDVTLEIFNMRGQRVKTLVNKTQAAGSYELPWNAINEDGMRLASGVYFFKLHAQSATNTFIETKKMILMK